MRSTVARIIIVAIMALSICSAALANNKPMVNLNIVDGQVRDVLAALADIGDINLVVDDSVTGNITIQLRDVSFDTALELVAKSKGLIYHQIENVLVVGTNDQIGRGFGNMHIFKLKYINPNEALDNVKALFLGQKKTAEKKETSTESLKDSAKDAQKETQNKSSTQKNNEGERLVVDYGTNSLVFYGTAEEAAKIQKLLEELDIPYQQVSLEAEVVAINKDNTKDLGIEWSWDATPTYAEYEAPTYETVYDADGNPYRVVATPGKVTRESAKGVIQFGRNPEGYPYEFYYQAKINALVSNGNAKILAKPKITAINGKKAQILIGDRLPVLVDSVENGVTKTTIQYIEAGIRLIYTPRINTDGQITANVRTEVSSPTLVTELKAYRITTREAETTVRLKDGETMVIGGLIGSSDSETKKAVPFLSDLPILGALFKNQSKSKSETEVVIFLTPRIVK